VSRKRLPITDADIPWILELADAAEKPLPTQSLGRPLATVKAKEQAPPRLPTTPQLRRMSEVKPERMTSLWDPYIPCGCITFLEGDPGEGKSYIGAALATAGSRGHGLPGIGRFEPWRTLICTAEDSLEHVLSWRLEDMNADQACIFGCGEPFLIDSEDGLAILRQWVEEAQPRLVIIDPISAYLSGKRDLHRSNEVREALAPLAALAREFNIALVIVRHLSKGQKGKAVYAGLGSIDFSAAARSVLLAGGNGEGDETVTGIVHVKSNYGLRGPAIGYSIKDGCFGWTEGPCPLVADDILRAEEGREERSRGREADDFLWDQLADGPVLTKELESQARAAGISLVTLGRARHRLGVRSRKRGFGKAPFEVYLPSPTTSPAVSSQPLAEPAVSDPPIHSPHTPSPKDVRENGENGGQGDGG
jgi:AAA domain